METAFEVESNFRKLNSNDHWCECSDGSQLMEGWCVKAYLNTSQKTDYIRIQKELLKLKNDLSLSASTSSFSEGEERRQLIIFLQVTVLFLVSSIILTIILKYGRKIAQFIKFLFATKYRQ